MLRNDLTGAQTQVGAMEGRRDFAGAHVAETERANVATEQAIRTGGMSASAKLPTCSPLARGNQPPHRLRQRALRRSPRKRHLPALPRNRPQRGTGREGPSIYARARETAGYDIAERAGKLDAQREVGTGGTRAAARIGEQRRQKDNFGFAQGAAAAGSSSREAARLDSFIRTLGQTAGNQVDMASGGAACVLKPLEQDLHHAFKLALLACWQMSDVGSHRGCAGRRSASLLIALPFSS